MGIAVTSSYDSCVLLMTLATTFIGLWGAECHYVHKVQDELVWHLPEYVTPNWAVHWCWLITIITMSVPCVKVSNVNGIWLHPDGARECCLFLLLFCCPQTSNGPS